MPYLLLILPGLSFALLAAHFYRAGQLALAAASLALIALLAVPQRWAARAVQVALALGALEWLRTLAVFAAERISAGQPYLRLVAILLAVAAFTAASALVFRDATLRVRYNIGGRL
jgi:hypothetical protein